MFNRAVISPDRLYRYALSRQWEGGGPVALIIGLNPSTADATKDDNTIRRCIRFATNWGYGSLWVGNLFAYRTKDPVTMKAAENPIGPDNNKWLSRLSGDADLVVAAWGNHGSYQGRDKEVLALLGDMMCFGLTKLGQPKHPLYLPYNTKLIKLDSPAGRRAEE